MSGRKINGSCKYGCRDICKCSGNNCTDLDSFRVISKKTVCKKVYIVGWILLNFCIAHFVLLPNIWQSLLGMGVMLLMSCIMLEGKTEQKMLVIIACNVFMILVSMLRGRITFFLSGKSINEISIQGSESLARVLGIVLTNTLYLLTAYILTCFFHDKIKLKKKNISL